MFRTGGLVELCNLPLKKNNSSVATTSSASRSARSRKKKLGEKEIGGRGSYIRPLSQELHVPQLNHVLPPPRTGNHSILSLCSIYNQACMSHLSFSFFSWGFGFFFANPRRAPSLSLTALLKKREYLETTVSTRVRTPWFSDHESLLRDSHHLLSLRSEQTALVTFRRDAASQSNRASRGKYIRGAKKKKLPCPICLMVLSGN